MSDKKENKRNEKNKKASPRYNISVIGYSGPIPTQNASQMVSSSELDGIGKSSFCARFMYPNQDEYSMMDKRSIINSIDFASNLINYHHTLWWGNTINNGLTFSLLEQTVFVDDSSLKVFDQDKNKKEPYEKRCAVVSFPNWNQRQFKGFSNDQDEVAADHMPDKFKIDAFLLLIDVSKDRTEKQPIEHQLELSRNILKSMKDIKKCPVVVALTKFDLKIELNDGMNGADPGESLEDENVRKVKEFFKSPEIFKKVLKKQEVQIVETSSEKNVNIEATFRLIASLVDKRRTKENKHKVPDIKNYREARDDVLKRENEVNERFRNFLKENLIQYETTYKQLERQFNSTDSDNGGADSNFTNFVKMFGTDEARKVWKERVKNLKNLYHETIIRGYKHFVDMALAELITEQTQLKPTWDELIDDIKAWPLFDNWFITLDDYDISNGHNGLIGHRGKYWYEDDHVSKLSDRRIPVHVLTDGYAGDLFRKDSMHRLQSKFLGPSYDATSYGTSSVYKNSIPNGKRSSSPSTYSSSTADKPISELHDYHDLDYLPSQRVSSQKYESNGRWSWNGSGNLKIFLLGSSGLSHLAQEINESSSEDDNVDSISGTANGSSLSRLEVINVEVDFTTEEERRLFEKGPHGCIAVYSNRATFNFCKIWLSHAVIAENGPFHQLPVSVLMASDQDLSEAENDQLIEDGKRLMAELKRADSSTGSFVAPEGGVYLDMRPIQQTQIKMGLQTFVNELKLISGYKRSSSIVSKTEHDGPVVISDSSCITMGIGSTVFDPSPVETFQKYLCQQGAVRKGTDWLRLDNVIFEFFSIPSQMDAPGSGDLVDNFASYDGVILCFSKSNSLQLCYEYMHSMRKEESYRPIQLFQGHADQKGHADMLATDARRKFADDIQKGYPIIASVDLVCPTMNAVNKFECRFAKRFEMIVSGATTIKTGRMFDSSIEEVPSHALTPDSTLNHNSTFDRHSTIGSSLTESVSTGESESVDSCIKDRISRFESHISKPSSVEHLDLPLRSSSTVSSPQEGKRDSEIKKGEKAPKRRKSRSEKKNDKPSSRHDSDNDSLNDMSTSVKQALKHSLHTSHQHLNDSQHYSHETSTSKSRFTTPHKIKEKFFVKNKTEKATSSPSISTDMSILSHNKDDFSDRYFRRLLGADGTFTDLTSDNGLVPIFLKIMISEIERIGMDHEGLYRVPADQKKRMELLKHFDHNFQNLHGESYDLTELSPTPNTLAGSVQWFLSSKNLPEPVIPSEIFPKLQDAMKLPLDDENKLERLRNVLLQLATKDTQLANWQTLKFVMSHLHSVTVNSDRNKMHAKNIATCLFPTLFPLDSTAMLMEGSGVFIDILCNLIEHHEEIFRDEPEKLKLMKQRELKSK